MNPKFWELIHGSQDASDLDPLTEMGYDISYLTDRGIPADELYYHNFSLHQFIWFKDGVYCDLYNLNVQLMEQMEVIKRITIMKQAVAEALEKGHWEQYFYFVDKKFIIATFMERYEEIPIEKLYDVFISIWTRAETGFERFTPDVLSFVFHTRQYSTEWKERMQSLHIKLALKRDKFAIYHGYKVGEYNPGDDCSWTLSKKVATWFANRFKTEGGVAMKKVTFDDCLDYLTQRNEDEILIWPFKQKM